MSKIDVENKLRRLNFIMSCREDILRMTVNNDAPELQHMLRVLNLLKTHASFTIGYPTYEDAVEFYNNTLFTLEETQMYCRLSECGKRPKPYEQLKSEYSEEFKRLSKLNQ